MPIYMKIEGITGTGKGTHAGWIVLESAQLGVHRQLTSPNGTGTNREASTPAVSEILVTKLSDSASSALFQMSLWGQGKKIIIHFTRTDGGAPYMAIELENVLISSYSVSGHGGTAEKRPMETFSLNFTKITYSTTPTQTPTNPKAVKERPMWDLAIGKGA